MRHYGTRLIAIILLFPYREWLGKVTPFTTFVEKTYFYIEGKICPFPLYLFSGKRSVQMKSQYFGKAPVVFRDGFFNTHQTRKGVLA